MAIFEVVLRLLGGFYVFAGIVAMRAVVMDLMMDKMLTAISLEAQPAKESHKRWLWAVSAMSISMGGAALMVLSLWALPLFLIGLATQAAYLLWARTAFPPENPLEEQGRKQTINAAILYGGATALVSIAAFSGILRGLLDPWALFIPATGALILVTVGRNLVWSPRKVSGFSTPDDTEDWQADIEPTPPLHRVKLEPRWGCYALIDADTNEDRQPDLYIPEQLALRIHHWMYCFGADDDTRTLYGMFEDADHQALHRKEGEDIVAELKLIFGEDNASGPFYPDKTVYVGPDEQDGEAGA